ncbi:retrovirus-related pol polyprotein from transposon TNT 1-94 [Tanacetum coccineum]
MDKDNKNQSHAKLLNKRTAHSSYIKHTQEEALVLRDIVEHVKANYPHDPLLESAVRYTKVIQDLLSHISRSCPSINNCGPQKTEAIPRKKDKQVRFAETLTLTKPASTSNIVANKRVLHSTGVRHSTCASGSQPSGNTKNDRIPQPPSSNLKNKVEAHHRNVKTSLNKKNGAVNVKGSAVVQNLKKQDNSDSICVNSNDCMSSDNLCVSNAVNVVKSRAKSKKHTSKKDSWKPTGKVFTQIGYIWRPTGRTFTIVGNACPLTRITTTNEVPSRKPIVLDSESPTPVVKLVYSRKPRNNTNAESVSKTKVLKPMSANKQEPSKSWGSTKTNIPSTSLNECRSSKSSSGTVKFGNDQVAKIMGFGDYQIGNVTISRVYYVEGLGHNLFSVGQFCDSNLEVAFRQHTHGLVRGLPKLKFEKDHLCSACALGKSSKKPHKPKSEDTNQEKLYLLHMDLCGPMRVASVSGKKYIPCNRTCCIKLVHTSSTTVDQDAPSPSNSHTTPETPTPIFSHDVEEDNHDIEVAHMGNDPYFGIPIPEVSSDQSSSDVIHKIVHPDHQLCKRISMTLERLEVWELVPPPDKAFVISLKWIYKVKLDELGGILKNKARLVARGYRQEEGIDFEESIRPLDTPMVEKSKLDEDKEGKAVDPSHYRGMIGTLLYLTASRPDLQFAICMCARIPLSFALTSMLQMRIMLVPRYKRRMYIRSVQLLVENGDRTLFVNKNTEYQLADIFTKALGRERIEFLSNKLGMRSFTPDTLKQLADEVDE